jgi:hypothetical protein
MRLSAGPVAFGQALPVYMFPVTALLGLLNGPQVQVAKLT